MKIEVIKLDTNGISRLVRVISNQRVYVDKDDNGKINVIHIANFNSSNKSIQPLLTVLENSFICVDENNDVLEISEEMILKALFQNNDSSITMSIKKDKLETLDKCPRCGGTIAKNSFVGKDITLDACSVCNHVLDVETNEFIDIQTAIDKYINMKDSENIQETPSEITTSSYTCPECGSQDIEIRNICGDKVFVCTSCYASYELADNGDISNKIDCFQDYCLEKFNSENKSSETKNNEIREELKEGLKEDNTVSFGRCICSNQTFYKHKNNYICEVCGSVYSDIVKGILALKTIVNNIDVSDDRLVNIIYDKKDKLFAQEVVKSLNEMKNNECSARDAKLIDIYRYSIKNFYNLGEDTQ